MITVYRVQSLVDGRGPWRPGLSKHWMDDEYDPERTATHPGIVALFGTDWLREIPMFWHSGCGCLSLEDLRGWFSEKERERLWSLGFRPVAMPVYKIVRQAANQVLFTRPKPLTEEIEVIDWIGS